MQVEPRPSAAALAGFKAGDVIRTIDGKAMTSTEGAKRFSTMRTGERVTFVVDRGGTPVELRLLVPE